MKTTICGFALTFVSVSASFAQESILNVRLHPILTIEVNPIHQLTNLDYITKADYINGVELIQPDHLNIYSTGAFVVKVKSSESSLINNRHSSKILSSDIEISTLAGELNPFKGETGTENTKVTLSGIEQSLLQSNVGGTNKTVSIKYKASGNNSYVEKYINNESPTIYSTQVVYSIEAK